MLDNIVGGKDFPRGAIKALAKSPFWCVQLFSPVGVDFVSGCGSVRCCSWSSIPVRRQEEEHPPSVAKPRSCNSSLQNEQMPFFSKACCAKSRLGSDMTPQGISGFGRADCTSETLRQQGEGLCASWAWRPRVRLAKEVSRRFQRV